jgi:hypothetical protein
MHRLQTAYTVYFNRRHQRHGHLFQGRFGARLVDEDDYILKLSRYVHLNPVFVKAHEEKTNQERVKILRHYRWSSYRSYIGLDTRLDFVDHEPVLALMGRPKKKQPALYRRFVEGGIRNIDTAFIESKQRSRFCIGSDESHERMQTRYQQMLQAYDRKEDVSFRRGGGYASTDEVVKIALKILNVPHETLARRGMHSMVRPFAAYALCQYAGCTQRAAAEVIGLRSGVAVSVQLRKLHERSKSDKELRRHLKKLKAHFIGI